jgi:hypothetical protein
MQSAYKIIAHLVSLAVVVQAAVIAWAVFDLIALLQAGTTPGGPPPGGIVHGFLGNYVVPILALALLAVALLGRAGVKWALWLLLAVAVQIGLAYAAFAIPLIGLLHAANAFAVLALAELGARSVSRAPAAAANRRRMRAAH